MTGLTSKTMFYITNQIGKEVNNSRDKGGDIMKILEKTKKFYKDHRHAVVTVVSCIGCFSGGYVAKDIYDNYTSKKALDEWEFKKFPDGTEIGWAGYDPEESNKRFEEEQTKAREEYPEKFQIMEDAISKLDLDLDDNEMWMIENGEPVMFKDSWYK